MIGEGQGHGILGPVLRRAAYLVAMGVSVFLSQGFLGDLSSPLGGAEQAQVRTSAHAQAARNGRRMGDQGLREMTFRAGAGGHFLIEASVNGEDVPFILDTGASEIVLGSDMARGLGFDPKTLRYTERFQTANGLAMGARVTLRELRIGTLSLYDVPATIMAQPMPISLLGNTFLARLSGHEVHDGKLTIYW
ncbi:MAG: TIGR02281 family clan AA aspartic protease [Alphaproteobacteria bacterium]